MLTDAQKTLMSTTRGDLHRLTIVGVALLRGRANLVELNAMAAMAKPGKTKHLDAECRGVRAFESTLDRFATLLRGCDDDGILQDIHSGKDKPHVIQDATTPIDACLEATAYEKVTVGKATLVKDYELLSTARGLFIRLKAKYAERLTAAATLTAKGTVKNKERTKAEKAKAAFNALSPEEKAAMISQVTGVPVATPMPEVAVITLSAEEVKAV